MIRPALLAVLAVSLPQIAPWAPPFLAAEQALAAGENEEARASFERSLAHEPNHAPSEWGLACVAVAEGRAHDAFRHLERVAQLGGGEPALLRWDPDLAPLRADPRFEALATSWEESHERAKRCTPKVALPSLGWFRLQSADSVPWEEFATLNETLGRVRGNRASFISSSGPLRVVSIQKSQAFLQQASTGKWNATFTGAGWIRSHRLSDGGERLLLTRRGKSVANRLVNYCDLRDVQTGQVIEHRVPPADEFVLAPEGDLVLRVDLLSDGFRQLSLWELGDSVEPRFEFTRPACGAEGIAFLSDFEALAVLGESGTLTIYSMKSGERLHQFETGVSDSAQLRAALGGEILICFDPEKTSSAFRVTSILGEWKQEHLWSEPTPARYELKARSLHLLGSQFVCELRNGSFVLRDAFTGATLNRVAGKYLWTNSTWLPHPEESVLWGLDGVASFLRLDASSGRVTKTIPVDGQPKKGLELSRKGTFARALDADQNLYVVDLKEGASRVFEPDEPGSQLGSFRAAFCPDERSMLIRVSELELRWISLPECELLARVEFPAAPREVTWKSDGAEFAFIDTDGGVWRALVDRKAGAIFTSVVEVDGEALSIAYEPLRDRLWVGCAEDLAIAYEEGVETKRFEYPRRDNFGEAIGANRILFDPFGRRAYISSKGQQYVVAFDPETLRELWSRRFGHYNGVAPRLSLDRLGEKLSLSSGRRLPTIVDAISGEDLLSWDARYLGHCRLVEGTDFLATSSRGFLRVLEGRAAVERWQRYDYGERGALVRAQSGHVDTSHEVLEVAELEVGGRPVRLAEVAQSVLDPKRVKASMAGVVLDPPDLSAAISFDETSWLRLYIEGQRAFEARDHRRAEELLRCALQLRPRHAPLAYSLARVMSARLDTKAASDWLMRCAKWDGTDSHLFSIDSAGRWVYANTRSEELDEAWRLARARRLANPPELDLSMATAPFVGAPTLEWVGDPTGEILIAATPGGELLSLNRKTGRVRARLRISNSALSRPRFSPDGSVLATVDEDGVLALVKSDLAWIRGTFAMPPGAEFTFANNGDLLLVLASSPLILRTRDISLAQGLTELAHYSLSMEGPPETLAGQRASIDLTHGSIQVFPWESDYRAKTPLEISGGKWDRYDFADGSWLLRSAGGHVDGSFEAFEQVTVKTKSGLRSLLELAPEIYDPNRVLGYIAETSIRPGQSR